MPHKFSNHRCHLVSVYNYQPIDRGIESCLSRNLMLGIFFLTSHLILETILQLHILIVGDLFMNYQRNLCIPSPRVHSLTIGL